MSDPAISVRNVIVSFDGRRVPDGINLEVERGETMVRLRGSGSDKSTLLRQIIGLDRPQSGQVVVNGIDLNRSNRKELKKLHRSMGVAFQNAALFDSLSLEDNVALPLRELTSLDESTIRLMTRMKLAVVGLADVGKLTPQALSGGNEKTRCCRSSLGTRCRNSDVRRAVRWSRSNRRCRTR